MRTVLRLLVFLAIASFSACSRPPAPSPRTLTVANETGAQTTVFVTFGADSVVRAFPSCAPTAPLACSFTLPAGGTAPLPFTGYLNAVVTFGTPATCGSTKAELNLSNPKWYDVVDISLVDGFSVPISITADGRTIEAKSAKGNEKAFGVYPFGCDVCVARERPPCGITPGRDGCKAGTQYKPDVPCQAQGSVMGGGGGSVRVTLMR